MGAVATGGVRVLNPGVIQSAGVTQAEVDAVTLAEQAELERRQRAYRDARPCQTSVIARLFWLTMGWQPAPPCTLPSSRCASKSLPA